VSASRLARRAPSTGASRQMHLASTSASVIGLSAAPRTSWVWWRRTRPLHLGCWWCDATDERKAQRHRACLIER
jgi:hypothetical protein